MARTQTAMLAFLAIAAVALYSLNHTQPVNKDFQIWKHKYNKQYSSHQDQYRSAVWLKNLEFVEAHQRRFQAGLQTYQVEMNHFADLTSQEFAASHLTNFPSAAKTTTNTIGNTNKCTGKAPSQVELPDQIDWTKKGAVTAVKNQGQCGSCWAFSTTGSTQGAYFISGQQLTAFSEQQLVDCSHKYGNNGCLGGLMNYSFWYIKDHGITSESKYPYRGWKLPSCKYQESDKVWSISDCHQVAVGSEQALRAAVAQQPVSVAIQANQAAFQLYKSGVFSDEKCGTKLDHGVLVVGYGVQNNKPFWKVKNSWAEKWGDEGYIKILINGDGHGLCGIQLAPSFPIA